MADGRRWLELEDEEEWDRYRQGRGVKRGESREGDTEEGVSKPRRRQRPRRPEQEPPDLRQPSARRFPK